LIDASLMFKHKHKRGIFCAIELMKQLKALQHKCDFGEVKANAIDYVLYVL
jgi:hypothetical protein